MERLQDSQQAEKFIRLLLEADRQREAKECRHLLEQIDDLEWQLETVGRELQSLKGQLGKAGRGTPERSLKTVSRRVEREVRDAKKQIREIKDSTLSGMKKAVRSFKKKGAAALDGVIDKLHIRVMLRSISMGMERSAINMQETIDRISAASEESQKTKIHKKNISRALMGKEREEIPEEFCPGVLARSAMGPFKMMMGLCAGIRKQADALEERIVQLSRYAGTDRGQENRQAVQTQEQLEFQEPQIKEWWKFYEPQMPGQQEVHEKQEERGERNQEQVHIQPGQEKPLQTGKTEQAQRKETFKSLQEYKNSRKQKVARENHIQRGREGIEL